MQSAARPSRPRLADVAREAGTSKPIASRILNADPTLSVRPELRERVLTAARELGYRPHHAARALRRARSSVLGMLVPPLLNPVYAQIIRGAFARAAERDFTVLLAEDIEGHEAGDTFAQLVLTGRIDGLIVTSAHPGHPLLPLLEEYSLPYVFANRAVAGSDRSIVMDDEHGVAVALEHLAALGHTRIAHIAGPASIEPSARRAQAFRSWLTDRGLDGDRVEEADFLEMGGASAARALLARFPDTTAVFTSTASQGIGVLNVAWKLGIPVPERLSVIAAADMPLSEFLVPPLTAVAMPLAELGAAAVDALIHEIEGGQISDQVIETRPRLVVRESTAVAQR